MAPRCLAVWAALAALFSQCGIAAEPLSFSAALDLAEQRAAPLRSRHAALEAAQSRQAAAGRLPDPRLTVGVDNLPVSGPDAYTLSRDFMTMRRIGWMQEVPNAARRAAQADVAQALADRERAMLEAERLATRREAALAWLARHYAEQRLAWFAKLEGENRLLQNTLAARVSSGQALPADAVMARQEAVQLADRRDELERDAIKARIALRRWLGEAADAPLLGPPPSWSQAAASVDAAAGASADVWRQQFGARIAHHAELAVFEPMKQMAAAEARDAEAEQHGDWGWELAYAKRGSAYGDMLSFQLSFDLPLWRGTRQLPRWRASQKELERVQAEQDEAQRRHAAELDTQLAELDALERTLARLEREGLPLAQRRVELLTASYQSGRADLAAVLAARRDAAEQGLRALDLRSQCAALRAQLNYLSAPDYAAPGGLAVQGATQ